MRSAERADRDKDKKVAIFPKDDRTQAPVRAEAAK